MRAGRQEVEGETGEDAAGQERRCIPAPPERNEREDQPGDEQDSAPQDEIGIRLPEIEEHRPAVEGVERGVRVGLGCAAHETHELGSDAGRVEAPERNAEHVRRRGGGAERQRHRTPPCFANELEDHGRHDHDEADAELRLHQGGESGERSGEPPPPRSRGDERPEERQRSDRIDLSPVRTGEDGPRLQRPDRGGQGPGRAAGAAPHHARREERDADVGGDADRFDREPKEFAVEETAEKPQHVEEGRRIVAEVPRFVEAAWTDLREPLGPGLERADVGREALRARREETDDHAERDDARDDEPRAALAATEFVVHCQYPKRVIAIVA